MKQILIATLLTFSSLSFADTFSAAKIDSVNLDSKMHLILRVKTQFACDQITLPQISQDPSNPTVFNVQAIAVHKEGPCISTIEKFKDVSLPALMEVASIKLSKLASYTFKFDGIEEVLIIPGNSLMTSIQPAFSAE